MAPKAHRLEPNPMPKEPVPHGGLRVTDQEEIIRSADTEVTTEELRAQRRALFSAMHELWYGDTDTGLEALADLDVMIKGTRYRFKERLGQGGFGNAFLVENTTTGQTCVMKISDVVDLHSQQVSPTLQESRANIGTAQKPRNLIREIAMLYQLTRKADDVPVPQYINAQFIPHPDHPQQRLAVTLMEYIDGPTIEEVVAEEGHLANHPDIALNMIYDIMQAVQGLHRQGIVHNDLKPDNIKLKNFETVTLLDLGLASYLDRPPQFSGSGIYRHDVPGIEAGAEDYLPPTFIDKPHVERDIYALGRIIQNMLFGENFKNSSMMRTLTVRARSRAIKELAALAERMCADDTQQQPRLLDALAQISGLRDQLQLESMRSASNY